MPSRSDSLVRFVIFVGRPLLAKVSTLAKQYGLSKSEVFRLATTRGLVGLPRELRRIQQKRLRESGEASGIPAPNGGGRLLTLEAAVDVLRRYGQSVQTLGQAFDPDALRVVISAHARTLAIAPDDFDDAVAGAAEALLGPAESAVETAQVLGGFDPHEPPE